MSRFFNTYLPLILTGAGALYLAVDYFVLDRWTWHQKLTLVVETPGGEVTGSAVGRATWYEKIEWLDRYNGRTRGEATVVEIMPGRYLFALVKDTEYLAFYTFNGNAGLSEERFAAMAERRGTEPVPREQYPLMVTFRDINNPMSVVEVDPDNLAATFGPGHTLKSVTLTLTDEPVTRGRMESILGWLNEYYNKGFDGSETTSRHAPNRLANSLRAGYFDTDKN